MEYVFEQLEESDNPSVIFRGIVGSRAYGTANAQSALDGGQSLNAPLE